MHAAIVQVAQCVPNRRTTDAELTPVPLPPFRAFYDDSSLLLSRFIAHVREGAPLECGGRDHLRTLALCFAAIESGETAVAVQYEAFCRRNGVPLDDHS